MGGTMNIFLIYTKEDSAMLLQLLHHLDPLKKLVKVHYWYDDPIYPNKTWFPQIVSRFEDADVYLLLVSNTFMHSQFIQQLEFKTIIDKYKAGQSKVIPVILENCPWDIDFEADEYTFNFKELTVLPEAGKPLKTWKSTEHALRKCAADIKNIIAPGSDDQKHGMSETKEVTETKYKEVEVQIAPALLEETETEKKAEALKRSEEVAAKKAIAAQRLLEESQAKERAVEKQRLQEVAEAKHKSDEDYRIKQAAIAKERAQEEDRLQERMEAKSERIMAAQAASPEEEQGKPQGENKSRKKGMIFGASVVAIVILGILLFPRNNTQASEVLTPQEKSETNIVKETNEEGVPSSVEKSEPATLNAAASMSKPEVGNNYKDGIVFEIDGDGKTGRLAHRKDVGPMTWNEAIIIHEQLGERWRLPTLEELKHMYKTIGQGATNSGEFADEFYWSATPYDVNQARLVRFQDGNSSYHYNSRGTHRKFLVRAVRDFSQ